MQKFTVTFVAAQEDDARELGTDILNYSGVTVVEFDHVPSKPELITRIADTITAEMNAEEDEPLFSACDMQVHILSVFAGEHVSLI